LLLVALVALSAAAPAQTPGTPFALRISEPRAFGYTLGDSITRELLLDVSAPYQLLTDSLPQAGRVDLWLEIDAPQLQHSRDADIHHYRIRLTYRLINLADPEQMITIPAHALKISDELMTRSVPVAEFRFAAHQVAPNPQHDGFPQLQPLAPPPPLALDGYILRLAVAGVPGLAGVVVLAWIYGLLPWLQRARGPFARAYKELRRQPAAVAPETALRSLHRAFDATAGETLFREDLDDFFTTRPQFAPLRQQIEAFFAYSRQQFFDPDSQAVSVEPMILARQLRAAERHRP
jgi:mxaA protein